MIVTAVECEVCDKTVKLKKEEELPGGWLVLHEPYQNCYWHFCSREHLGTYLGVSEPTQPLEQPQTKMRRFLLVDEDANETEGILWGHGQVSLNGSSSHMMNFHCQGNFLNWDDFKHTHEGCGVTWIDQEVQSDAAV